MEQEKLKQIINEKVEYDPFWADDQKTEKNHIYYYTIILNEEVYNITTDSSCVNIDGVEQYEGFYVHPITYNQLDAMTGLWRWLVANSKTYRAGVTEEEIERYNFCGQYLFDLEKKQKSHEEKLKEILSTKHIHKSSDRPDEPSENYYYSIYRSEEVYYITDDLRYEGQPGVEYFEGFCITKMPIEILDEILQCHWHCVVNIESWLDQQSEGYKARMDFLLKYSQKILHNFK